VLYAELHPVFGYDSINLQVLEREGWYHSLPIDRGVVQDVTRRLLSESYFADYYKEPRPYVVQPRRETPVLTGRGPGVTLRPRTLVWLPLIRGGQPVGSISYQLTTPREVSESELSLLGRVHEQLGDQVVKVYRNELTRNQAVGLGALNVIASALSAAGDESEIAAALLTTLSGLMAVDCVELAIRDEPDSSRLRVVSMGGGPGVTRAESSLRAKKYRCLKPVLDTGEPQLAATELTDDYPSAASVAIVEAGVRRGVLTARCHQHDAYEYSTLAFLQQVADQVALALRSAWSYAALDRQRQRLEIVNSVGRRLVSCLDRSSIMRTLRESLAEHMKFDNFTLATVRETAQGMLAEGYTWDSGEERPRLQIPLMAAGPAREAYLTGEPVLIRRSPWARKLEAVPRSQGDLVINEHTVMSVSRPGHHRRFAARSIVWVPVRQGEEVVALLSLQSYRQDAFDEWHASVLEDVAGNVGLALANADHFQAAQSDRHRLEALHVLEVGVQGAGDEEQIARAVLSALRSYVEAPIFVLGFMEAGRLSGYSLEEGKPLRRLPPVGIESTVYFKRQLAEGTTIVEMLPAELRQPRPAQGWPTWGPDIPLHFLSVPLFYENRVVGCLSAQRLSDQPFTPEEIQLFESAAPVVGIGWRTVRLQKANEMAMANSVRLQNVAGLAGQDLGGVLENVADMTRSLLGATGAACWAFEEDGRVALEASRGSSGPRRILRWSGRTRVRNWQKPPMKPVSGHASGMSWTLIPLWHGQRMVGALGAVRRGAETEDLLPAVGDFAQHAAIAIENARLATETRGRIHALEAVAAFANLDIARPERAKAEMCRLVERALASAGGTMWVWEAGVATSRPDWWRPALESGGVLAPVRPIRRAAGGSVITHPVVVDGDVVGMIAADVKKALPRETRRLMAVLAGQASVALGRLKLVGQLNRQRDMLRTVLEHSPVGVVLEDETGKVEYANPEIERIYGVEASALPGTSASKLLDRPDAVRIPDLDVEPGGVLEVRLEESGSVVQVRSVPIQDEGRPPRILRLHEDVTQERALLDARDLMLRAIGHEVRSPAAAMRSTLAGLLQWGSVIDPEQRHTVIAEAYQQSDRLLSLVENQLLIGKLEADRLEPHTTYVPLARAVEQVITVLRSRYGDRVNVIDGRLSSDLPDAYCDQTHLDEVLTNLIGNALEYTSARLVRVVAHLDGDWLEVTVSNDGGGIPADRRRDVFSKSGSPGRSRARGGLGLGLYLCRLVVERSFGGRIWLDRTDREGTAFKFTVPAAIGGPSRKAGSAASS
jgi:PAS domain S-box-containing protein